MIHGSQSVLFILVFFLFVILFFLHITSACQGTLWLCRTMLPVPVGAHIKVIM